MRDEEKEGLEEAEEERPNQNRNQVIDGTRSVIPLSVSGRLLQQKCVRQDVLLRAPRVLEVRLQPTMSRNGISKAVWVSLLPRPVSASEIDKQTGNLQIRRSPSFLPNQEEATEPGVQTSCNSKGTPRTANNSPQMAVQPPAMRERAGPRL